MCAYSFILLLLLMFYRDVFAGDRPYHLFSDIVLSFVSTSLTGRIRWLVARSIEAWIDAVALQ